MTSNGAQAHVSGGLAQFIAGAESEKRFLAWLQQQPLNHDEQLGVLERLLHEARSTGGTVVTLQELLVLRHHFNSLGE